jgi:hypothetical protein
MARVTTTEMPLPPTALALAERHVRVPMAMTFQQPSHSPPRKSCPKANYSVDHLARFYKIKPLFIQISMSHGLFGYRLEVLERKVSSFIIHHSSFIIHHSSFIIQQQRLVRGCFFVGSNPFLFGLLSLTHSFSSTCCLNGYRGPHRYNGLVPCSWPISTNQRAKEYVKFWYVCWW